MKEIKRIMKKMKKGKIIFTHHARHQLNTRFKISMPQATQEILMDNVGISKTQDGMFCIHINDKKYIMNRNFIVLTVI